MKNSVYVQTLAKHEVYKCDFCRDGIITMTVQQDEKGDCVCFDLEPNYCPWCGTPMKFMQKDFEDAL